VRVESLVPDALADLPYEAFLERLPEADDHWRERSRAAAAEDATPAGGRRSRQRGGAGRPGASGPVRRRLRRRSPPTPGRPSSACGRCRR
jgi:hypothetical protein